MYARGGSNDVTRKRIGINHPRHAQSLCINEIPQRGVENQHPRRNHSAQVDASVVPSTLSIQEIIMEAARSVEILKSLANGIDPGTGKPFAADSAYQHPDTVRALFFAIRALEQQAPQAPSQKAAAPDKPRPNGKPAPGKAGQPWSEEEDTRLGKAYDSGQSIEDLAQAHQRSKWAIEARLARMGKIPAPPSRFPARKSAGNAGTNEMRSQ
jgi:hypothetical protein